VIAAYQGTTVAGSEQYLLTGDTHLSIQALPAAGPQSLNVTTQWTGPNTPHAASTGYSTFTPTVHEGVFDGSLPIARSSKSHLICHQFEKLHHADITIIFGWRGIKTPTFETGEKCSSRQRAHSYHSCDPRTRRRWDWVCEWWKSGKSGNGGIGDRYGVQAWHNVS
jgi:hypothetical protein